MILCVGDEWSLLELRCAILQKAGYNTRMASAIKVESLLLSETYSLIILSAQMSEEDRRRITLAAGDTPVVALNGVTFPRDLLSRVASMIQAVEDLLEPSATKSGLTEVVLVKNSGNPTPVRIMLASNRRRHNEATGEAGPILKVNL